MLTVTIKINGIPRYDFVAINRTEKWGRGKFKVGVQHYGVVVFDHEKTPKDLPAQRASIQHPYGDLPGLVQKMMGLVGEKENDVEVMP